MNNQIVKIGLTLLVFITSFGSYISAEVLNKDSNNYLVPSLDILTIDTLIEDEIYTEIDQYPRYPGCEEIKDEEERILCAQKKMLTYIYENLSYPRIAMENGIQGTVITKFVVTKIGGIKDVELIRDIGGGCGMAVIAVIETMHSWIPGIHNDEAVDVFFTLPIKFKLEDNDKK